MIAYYYPPLGGIGSIRAAKFAQYLPEYGWAPTVIAPSKAPHHEDASLEHDENSVIRATSFELSRLGKRLLGGGGADPSTPSPPSSLHGRLRQLAHRTLYFPDPQVGWLPFALQAARHAMRDARFDAIFSSSFPITTHLVARRLQRMSGIPWVAEFRDPWADAVAQAHGRERRQRLERSILREADSVVSVSPTWGRLFAGKGARRVTVVTNGFDPPGIVPSRIENGEFVVTHLGSMYPGMQDLRSLWSALLRMRGNHPDLRVRIRFVGELEPRVREEIADAGLADVLEVTGFLPHAHALAAAAASSVLVMAGYHRDDPVYRGWIPAKLFEYLGSRLPVIYVGNTGGDATALLSQHPGCYVTATDDVDGLITALASARRSGPVAREVQSLTRRALAGTLANELDQVVSRSEKSTSGGGSAP